MPTDDIYTVSIEPFAERHYIKKFRKKYKKGWNQAEIAIQMRLEKFDTFLKEKGSAVVNEKQGVKICKTKFRIAGTKQSKSGSGNRCIVAVHTDTKEAKVLLVYNKTDLSGSGNETAQWKRIIKQNYPEYIGVL